MRSMYVPGRPACGIYLCWIARCMAWFMFCRGVANIGHGTPRISNAVCGTIRSLTNILAPLFDSKDASTSLCQRAECCLAVGTNELHTITGFAQRVDIFSPPFANTHSSTSRQQLKPFCCRQQAVVVRSTNRALQFAP